jgi:pimeloyl-ACP methyl ester carboxylesterase
LDLLSSKGIKPVLLGIPGLTEEQSKPFTLSDYVAWLRERIGRKKVILLGHSNGGRIAAAFASSYPGNVLALILVDSAGIYHKDFKIRAKRLVFGFLAKFGKKFFSSHFLRDLLYKAAGEMDYKDTEGALRETFLNLVHSDISSCLPKISAPTLIIWGEKDKVTPRSDGEVFKRLIRNSELKIIKDANHSPQFTHATEVLEAVVAFLRRNRLM